MVIRHGARKAASLTGLIMIMIGGLVLAAGVQAAPSTQQLPIALGAETAVAGTLNDSAPSATYTFPCTVGQVASVYAETTSGDLLVDVTVNTDTGAVIATGQVANNNPNITLAEAFVMPGDFACSLTLTRSGSTSGSYALRLLPGYAALEKWETFDGTRSPLHMEWPPFLSDSMEYSVRDGRLAITVMQGSVLGYIIPEDLELLWTDVYIQADFLIDGTPNYFEYGFLLRSDLAGNVFYSLTASSDSDWSYYFFSNDWFEIQPWTVSPVLNGLDQKPRLGVLLQGNTAQVFYNHRYVGEITDASQFANTGIIGIALATGANQNGFLVGYVDNVIITRPWGR